MRGWSTLLARAYQARQPRLGQPPHLRSEVLFTGAFGVWIAAPQEEGLVQAASGPLRLAVIDFQARPPHQISERGGVDIGSVRDEPIAGGRGLNDLFAGLRLVERGGEPGDVRLHALHRTTRRRALRHGIRDRIHRNDFAKMQHQDGQELSLLRATW